MPSIASEELAEGFMLVRASTLKIIRLQLAIERRDQRLALEAVDDLVALDRCLEQFLTHYPNPHQHGLLGNVLERERSALNSEKHTLAAGIGTRSWHLETPEPAAETPDGEAGDEEWVPPEPYRLETPRWWRLTVIAILLIAVGCAALFLFAPRAVPASMQGVL